MILSSIIIDNISYCNLNGDALRELIVKIGLERIDTQEGIIVEVNIFTKNIEREQRLMW